MTNNTRMGIHTIADVEVTIYADTREGTTNIAIPKDNPNSEIVYNALLKRFYDEIGHSPCPTATNEKYSLEFTQYGPMIGGSNQKPGSLENLLTIVTALSKMTNNEISGLSGQYRATLERNSVYSAIHTQNYQRAKTVSYLNAVVSTLGENGIIVPDKIMEKLHQALIDVFSGRRR